VKRDSCKRPFERSRAASEQIRSKDHGYQNEWEETHDDQEGQSTQGRAKDGARDAQDRTQDGSRDAQDRTQDGAGDAQERA
jgi:hypothetical protein